MLTLRPYQEAAKHAVYDGFSRKGEDVWDVRRVAGIWVANS
jgi:hypothetical protein